ncbi:MAG TPA: IgGFc-binding protein, partial [Candidatus Kapabacteria bacterium]|nr:IgGFc-binding protein [Candidatus Kapabacteria bacterium]
MKKLVIAGMLVLAACTTGVVQAQDRIQTSSTVSSSSSIKGFARDFYFCLLENYSLQQGGKYYQSYISSTEKTTVRVQAGGSGAKAFPLNPLEVLVFDVPLAWELTQSGVIEEKAIRVWSEDADLTVSLLSRNPATSDGMTILPVASWGNQYVVASFASYAYLSGYELPSEFAIVASQDSTRITILPSTDLRQGISTAVFYKRDSAFTIVLDRGEAVQYQASAANGNMEDYDVTGTIITADKPIGVEAGVECANVPAENPYCDHLCEMLLPVDRWGTTFYTAPFINRKGGDGMLVIAAQDNTTIVRVSKSGARTHATLDKFEHYMRHDIDEASEWRSDKPFMLVQYINGTDYPETGSNNGIGDPAMVVVPPTSLYEREILFHTPKISTTETQFRNYVNIVVNKNAVNSTAFDGQNILGKFGALDLPGVNYIIFRASDVKSGSHTITSDSAAGLYGYGYGSYDAYAWPMPMGSFARSLTDVQSPDISLQREECYSEEMLIVDAGAP